jgi:NhaC family Na+:H+ antiporter
MVSMLGTVFLILSALAFGGIMQATGQLGRLIRPLHQWATSDRKIMTAAGGTAIGINLIAADQYMAIVLTGSMYKKEFEARRISPQTLSRQIEDTATVTSPLIPWNSCGAYMSATLGVATIAYLPFAFFNWINPLLSFIYAALGLRIGHVDDETGYETVPEKIEVYGISQEVEEIESQI